MSLTERLDNPDRRAEPLPPIVERRGGEEPRLPTWMQRAKDGALYGYGSDGTPVAGKSMDGRRPA